MFGIAVVVLLAAFRAFAPGTETSSALPAQAAGRDLSIPENPTREEAVLGIYSGCLSGLENSLDRNSGPFCVCLTADAMKLFDSADRNPDKITFEWQQRTAARCNNEVMFEKKWRDVSVEDLLAQKSAN
jgi:hypothetical protein